MIPTETIPGHNMETIDIIIGVLHDDLTPVLIVPTVTPHIADHLHTGVHSLLLGPQQVTISFSIQTMKENLA